MKIILKLLIGILNLIFAVFKLLPVKNKVTFISRQSDTKTEDMELLEVELRKKAPDLKQVFLCKKLDGGIGRKISYCFHLITQMYHIATSKVVILDSYSIAVSVLKQRPSLVVIQMWHALGSLKRFGLSIVGEGEGRNESVASAMKMHQNYTYVLTSGKACTPYFEEAFGYGEETVKVMSLPRVDKLTNKAFEEEMIRKIHGKYPQFKEKKVIVYAPTFRIDKDISAEAEALASEFDSDKFAFVIKKHPLMAIDCKSAIVDEAFTTLEMFFVADYVICDYSAVIFEAAIMKKPLFFYAFDYESYGVERDFYIDYKSEMPGLISTATNEIAKAISADNYDLAKVEAFGSKYVECQEGCSERLADMIIGELN